VTRNVVYVMLVGLLLGLLGSTAPASGTSGVSVQVVLQGVGGVLAVVGGGILLRQSIHAG
jgi:hypothetical protein